MAPSRVLVIGETPSLGRSIVDLLEAEGVHAVYVDDIRSQGPLTSLAQRFPVVVAACNAPYCQTARQWVGGELPDVTLIVVGTRDPALRESPRLRLFPLPLLPSRFLGIVHGLLDAGTPSRLVSSGTA